MDSKRPERADSTQAVPGDGGPAKASQAPQPGALDWELLSASQLSNAGPGASLSYMSDAGLPSLTNSVLGGSSRIDSIPNLPWGSTYTLGASAGSLQGSGGVQDQSFTRLDQSSSALSSSLIRMSGVAPIVQAIPHPESGSAAPSGSPSNSFSDYLGGSFGDGSWLLTRNSPPKTSHHVVSESPVSPLHHVSESPASSLPLPTLSGLVEWPAVTKRPSAMANSTTVPSLATEGGGAQPQGELIAEECASSDEGSSGSEGEEDGLVTFEQFEQDKPIIEEQKELAAPEERPDKNTPLQKLVKGVWNHYQAWWQREDQVWKWVRSAVGSHAAGLWSIGLAGALMAVLLLHQLWQARQLRAALALKDERINHLLAQVELLKNAALGRRKVPVYRTIRFAGPP